MPPGFVRTGACSRKSPTILAPAGITRAWRQSRATWFARCHHIARSTRARGCSGANRDDPRGRRRDADQSGDRDRRAADRLRLPHTLRAQGPGPHAAAPRPQPRRPLGPASAGGRRIEAVLQIEQRPVEPRPLSLPARADDLDHGGARQLRHHSDQRARGAQPFRPFDLPEAETELVAGYHTEYSGLRFALFFMAEYINMIIVSSVATIVFLGGWWGPFGILPGPWWFLVKVVALLYVYVWLRATLPRMRYDRLMALSWKSLFPLSLAMMMVTAIVVVAAQGTL